VRLPVTVDLTGASMEHEDRDLFPTGTAVARGLSAFASELDDRFVLFDLRGAEAGDGFEWGRFGLHTELRRFGAVRLFACARTADAGAPRHGLFRRS